MINTQDWCGQALTALFSLWDEKNHHAWRASNEFDSRNTYYPTATFHAVAAFEECGVWNKNSKYQKGVLRTPYFVASEILDISNPKDVLLTLINQSGYTKGGSKPLNWVDCVLNQSSHSQSTTKLTFQRIIVISGLFQALRALVSSGAIDTSTVKGDLFIRAHITSGLRTATKRLLELVKKSGEITTNMWLSENEEVSPNLLLHLAIALRERDSLIKELSRYGISTSPKRNDSDLQKIRKSLSSYFERELNRLMARRHVPTDPQYDPTSLAFAMHGYVLLNESVRRTPFFRACARAVVDGQNADGCWPDGVSITYLATGNVIQQPSVEIALRLGEAIFHPELLIDHNTDEIELLKTGLEALSKTAKYLTVSNTQGEVTKRDGSARKFSGWVSDRVRRPGISETWITAMAARFLNILWLAERAVTRAETLSKYGVESPLISKTTAPDIKIETKHKLRGRDTIGEYWREKVIEPDSITLPANELLTKVLKPIKQQQERGDYILHPVENGVSFIIYGPPGSGKTYLIKALAEVLDWPLLTLTPGHFIRKGLEFIEATSAEIFKDLMSLDHAVIFFDECDELFRDREEETNQGRNILSFATASMLPKLQDLHDRKGVIFFLGTNYLSHVDTAIRRQGRFDGILLYDRPDKLARKTYIIDRWMKETGRSLHPDLLKSMIERTAGWMVKEIYHLVTLEAQGMVHTYKANVLDYVEWCAQRGMKEIVASGIDEQMRKKILKRWEMIPGYKDTKR